MTKSGSLFALLLLSSIAHAAPAPKQTGSGPAGPATPTDPTGGDHPTTTVGPATPPSPFQPWWKEPARSWVYTHRTKGSAWAANVLIGPGEKSADFVTCLDHPRLNGQPEAIIQVTPTMSPDSTDLAPYESVFFGRENILYTSDAVVALWTQRSQEAGMSTKGFPLPRDRWCIRVASTLFSQNTGICGVTAFWLVIPLVTCKPDGKDQLASAMPMLSAQFEGSAWNVTFSLPPGAGK